MLLKTHEEIKEVSEINTGVKFHSIKSSIDMAEIQHIKPILGEVLYNELNTLHNGTGTPTTLQSEIIVLCQKAIVPLALANYTPMMAVQISDAGITNANSGDQKAAYKYEVQNFQQSNVAKGLFFLEELIKHLDKNATALTSWNTSEEYKKQRHFFIQTGTEFAKLYTHTPQPRQLYLQLQSSMEAVETFTIKPLITETIFNDLKSKLQAPTPTFSTEEKELLLIIKNAITFLSIEHALPHLNARIDEHGITVLSPMVDSSANDMGKRGGINENYLNFLSKNCHDIGQKWLQRCVSFLDEKASANLWSNWYNTLQQKKQNSNCQNAEPHYKGLFYL